MISNVYVRQQSIYILGELLRKKWVRCDEHEATSGGPGGDLHHLGFLWAVGQVHVHTTPAQGFF